MDGRWPNVQMASLTVGSTWQGHAVPTDESSLQNEKLESYARSLLNWMGKCVNVRVRNVARNHGRHNPDLRTGTMTDRLTNAQLIARLSKRPPDEQALVLTNNDLLSVVGVLEESEADTIITVETQSSAGLPRCERCSRVILDSMVSEFAPFCSRICKENDATERGAH